MPHAICIAMWLLAALSRTGSTLPSTHATPSGLYVARPLPSVVLTSQHFRATPLSRRETDVCWAFIAATATVTSESSSSTRSTEISASPPKPCAASAWAMTLPFSRNRTTGPFSRTDTKLSVPIKPLRIVASPSRRAWRSETGLLPDLPDLAFLAPLREPFCRGLTHCMVFWLPVIMTTSKTVPWSCQGKSDAAVPRRTFRLEPGFRHSRRRRCPDFGSCPFPTPACLSAPFGVMRVWIGCQVTKKVGLGSP